MTLMTNSTANPSILKTPAVASLHKRKIETKLSQQGNQESQPPEYLRDVQNPSKLTKLSIDKVCMRHGSQFHPKL